MTSLRGTMYLKVTSILYIVLSSISLAVSIITMTIGGLALVGGGDSFVALSGAIIFLVGAVVLVSVVFSLVVGILGVKNCRRADKANTLFVLGIILVVFDVIALISTLIDGDISAGAIIGDLLGLVLSGLFVYGAYLNKQDYQQMLANAAYAAPIQQPTNPQ